MGRRAGVLGRRGGVAPGAYGVPVVSETRWRRREEIGICDERLREAQVADDAGQQIPNRKFGRTPNVAFATDHGCHAT